LSAGKVVKRSYIIRKNSFIDKKTRNSIIDWEDGFTGSALQTIFNLDNRVGRIDGTTENREEVGVDHSIKYYNIKTPLSQGRTGFLLNSMIAKKRKNVSHDRKITNTKEY